MADAARVLCLGNDLVADDAFGPEVARALRDVRPGLPVVEASVTGVGLIDEISGAQRLIVVDTVVTGSSVPGSVYVVPGDEIPVSLGGALHTLGLFEVLLLGRALGLEMPEQVTVVAVEAGDLVGIGAPMTPEVRAALPRVVEIVTGLGTGG